MATKAELEKKRADAIGAKRSLLRRFRSRVEQIRRLTRKIKAKPSRRGLPTWVPDHYANHWRHPWTKKARDSGPFKRLCWANGYASPNFTEAETRCKDGTRVPESLRVGCQEQAFQLEQVRHELGDVSMPALSWYRHRAYNDFIGGAPGSKHIDAIATDFDVATVSRIGRDKFDAAFEKVYANDGYGSYPAGSRHGDVRGEWARWTSF